MKQDDQLLINSCENLRSANNDTKLIAHLRNVIAKQEETIFRMKKRIGLDSDKFNKIIDLSKRETSIGI